MLSPMAAPTTLPTDPTQYLTDEAAASLLDVEPKTIRVWRRTRGLPFIRLSSRAVRIRRADLEAWLETMRERRVVLSH